MLIENLHSPLKTYKFRASCPVVIDAASHTEIICNRNGFVIINQAKISVKLINASGNYISAICVW